MSIVTILIIGFEPVINVIFLLLYIIVAIISTVTNAISNIVGFVKEIINALQAFLRSIPEKLYAPIIIANLLITFCAIITPVALGQIIGLGVGINAAGNETPAQGWLFTQGLNKGKYWSGPFSGALPIAEIIDVLNPLNTYVSYPGILGFTGLKITTLTGTKLLGSALWVKIRPESPD
jgi:hypothetical protein